MNAAFMRLTPWQLALRGTIVFAGGGLVAVTLLASDADNNMVLLLAGVLLASAAAAVPDSHLALFVVGYAGVLWVLRTPDTTSGWTLIAGLLVAVFHTASALAAGIPPSAPADRAMLRSWAVRLGVAVGAASVVWFAMLLVGDERSANPVVFGLALLCALAGVIAVRDHSAAT